MPIDYKVKDVQVKKGPVNWKSYSFLRELVKVRQENERIDRISKIDYQRMFRRIEI